MSAKNEHTKVNHLLDIANNKQKILGTNIEYNADKHLLMTFNKYSKGKYNVD